MNYNQRFDEHIKEQFLDYTPQVHPRIWENIAAEREKKRPVGFWISLFNRRTVLLLAGLLLAAGGGAYFLLKDAAPASGSSETAAVTGTEKSPATNNAPALQDNTTLSGVDDVTGNNSTPVSPVNSPGNNNAAAAVTGNVTTKATGLPPAGDAATANGTVFSFPGTVKKQDAATKQKIKIKNGVAGFANDDIIDAADEVTGVDALSPLFYMAEKNKTLITASVLSKRSTSNVKEPGCPTIEKDAAGNKTYIEVYGGPDMAFRSMSDTGNSVYLQKRKESTTFSSAFSAGIRYTRVFNNGISIRTGINYSQINEKFTYSEGNIVQVVYIINNAGDTIGSYTTTGSRYKTTYNKFKTLDVPVVLGYELGNGNFHTNINAGVIINAYSWQKGEVLDARLQPVDITTGKSSSPYQFKTNIGIGFIGSVSLYYKLNEKLHLLAEPYFRYNLTPASKEIITFKQKYNTAGLRLGLRLDLR
jgi:hypothetical protein